MGLNWMCFRGFGGVPPLDMPSSAEGQVVSEQGVVCGAHLPEEAPPFGRGVSLSLCDSNSRAIISDRTSTPLEVVVNALEQCIRHTAFQGLRENAVFVLAPHPE